MSYTIKRNINETPTDPTEFENAVRFTIQRMVKDGSIYASYRDIFYYNRWTFSGHTSRRIGRVLRNKLNMKQINSRCYKIPEELMA